MVITLFSNYAQAQISGIVFFDGNNDGVKQAAEAPFTHATVTAFDALGNSFSATSNASGNYTIAGIVSGTPYRVELSMPAGYNDAAFGSSAGTSVQFADGSDVVDFGINLPDKCDPDKKIRVVTGLGIWHDDHSVKSWDFLDDREDIDNMGSDGSETTHTDDILASQIGVPFGVAAQRKTRIMYMSTISATFTDRFPAAPDGGDAIYAASYAGGANNTYVGRKLLTNMSDYGISTAALNPVANEMGEYGLGGVAISDDGGSLYVVNMGKGNIAKFDISAVTYATIPSGGYNNLTVTEISLPGTNCSNGIFRPSAIEYHAGALYIVGICDASISGSSSSDLRLRGFKMDVVTNALTQVLDYDLSTFTGGGLRAPGWPQKKWSTTWLGTENAGSSGEIQPIVPSIAFDDNGALIIGVTNRQVFVNGKSNREPGYMLRTWREANGSFTVENAGVSGPYTSTAKGSSTNPDGTPGYYDGSDDPSTAGPGNDWFFEVGRTSVHPYLYAGGTMVVPGTNMVVGGFTNPGEPINQAGGRYLDYTTGVAIYGTSVMGVKATVMSDVEVVCKTPPIELGNRVWLDTDKDGVQDPGENGIAGITVELYQGNTLIATATTDNNGLYIFSSDNQTSTASFKYGLTINQLTPYTIRIPNIIGGSQQSNLSGFALTTPNTSGTSNDENDKTDSDGISSGNNADVSFSTGTYGKNSHVFDFGFYCNLTASAGGTPVSCHGGNNGTATATPTGNNGAVTYLWSNGATTQTISGLSAGTYTVTITDAVNCTAIASYTVTEPPVMDVTCTSTDVTTNGGSDGTASVTASGGTPPYTYLWNTGATTSSISGLVAGTYSVTVTDAKGCTAECSTTVNEPGCNLSASADGTPVSCNDGSDGTATATPTGNNGAVTYLWSNGATTQSISGLSAGTYTVTITDAVNCTAIASYTVTEPPVMDVTCSSTDVTTNGGSDGTASVTASGGTPPYTYLWNTGATTSSISGLTAGTYTVTVTDAKGCTAECSTTVNEPAPCELTDAGKTNETCNDNNTAANLSDDYITFSLNPTGTQLGTGYTVSVSGGFTISPTSGTYGSATAFQLNAGSANGSVITVTITDNNDAACTITTTVQKSNCSAGEPDLSLTKEVDDCEGEIGQNTIFTLTLENTGTADATGVVITDVLPAGLTYISHTPNNITYNQVSGEFNVGTVAVGQTVTIQITVQPTAPGYYCNTANITATSGDSSVDNDEGRACFMVPIELCPGDSYTITLDAGLTNIQWYKDGILIPGATEASLTITEPGVYSYTADNANCPQTGCCPVVFILGNCCPAPRCVAVGVIKLN